MNMQEAALLKAHLDRAAGLEAEVAALRERVSKLESEAVPLMTAYRTMQDAAAFEDATNAWIEATPPTDTPDLKMLKRDLTPKRKPGRPKKNAEARA